MAGLGRMSPAEYEERYAQALGIVRREMADNVIGVPKTTPSGSRLVVIDGMLQNDEALIALAWSKKPHG